MCGCERVVVGGVLLADGLVSEQVFGGVPCCLSLVCNHFIQDIQEKIRMFAALPLDCERVVPQFLGKGGG